MSFVTKVVIVTGAGSGIGAATAISFAKKGANVVIVDRKIDKLLNVKEKCAEAGKEPFLIEADITNDANTKRIIDETVEKFGKIDILINNAGIIDVGGIFRDNVMEIYDSVMSTNLRGHVHITSLAAPHLIKTKGNIINISSALGKGLVADSPTTIYGTSKAALLHFTRNVAAELAPHGVRVNTISPGPVKTDLLPNSGFDMDIEDDKEILALKRISNPQEIADLILFLASDKAVSITGSDYAIDNGFMLK